MIAFTFKIDLIRLFASCTEVHDLIKFTSLYLFSHHRCVKCDSVLSSMEVDSERMRENIDSQNGLIMAEKVMLELVDRGMPREEAHEVLRKASLDAVDQSLHLEDACRNSKVISGIFEGASLSALFDPRSHLGSSGKVVDLAVGKARDRCSK